ncbi:hypothetical protein [Nocardia carnea]|uniref:hypothetical protein n=1 Tax=Nocardia carnea TaxID=37328 RepID=UPI0024585E6D|nr:hypothetical protein [Nocardia carnea]
MAPGFRTQADGDPDYADRLDIGAGFGAYPAVNNLRERREARRQGLTNFADEIDGTGDIGYRGAAEFEHTDADRGASVKRVSDEV